MSHVQENAQQVQRTAPPPPRPKPRRKRARVALTGAERAGIYAELLAADEYSEAARDALRKGDAGAVRHALSVLRAIVEVVAGKFHEPSSECRVPQ